MIYFIIWYLVGLISIAWICTKDADVVRVRDIHLILFVALAGFAIGAVALCIIYGDRIKAFMDRDIKSFFNKDS